MLCVCKNPNCSIPYGTCHCGCGETTQVSTINRKSRGILAGDHSPYSRGHTSASRPREAMAQPDDPTIRYIPLTLGKHAVVDAADYEGLMRWKWFARITNVYAGHYAYRNSRKGDQTAKHGIAMHSVILPPPYGLVIDHISGDTLDNRRSNLRCVTPRENRKNLKKYKSNKSGVPGVTRASSRGKIGRYRSRIRCDGVEINLGRSDSLKEATRLREEAEIKYFGELRRKKD